MYVAKVSLTEMRQAHSHTLQNAFCLAINLTLEAEVNCFVRGIFSVDICLPIAQSPIC